MKWKELEDAVIQKYSNATAIYLLQRTHKMSKKDYAFDFLVALFTPAPGIVEEADMVADFAYYYLVEQETQSLLVRADKKGITEKNITDLYAASADKKFVIENNRFKKVKKVYG